MIVNDPKAQKNVRIRDFHVFAGNGSGLGDKGVAGEGEAAVRRMK